MNSRRNRDFNEHYKAYLDAVLRACAKDGVRPLILLNANSDDPEPMKNSSITLAAAADVGATSLTVTPASLKGLRAGIPGFPTFQVLREQGQTGSGPR